MKIAYEHLIKFIPSRPSIENISEKFFQLGHEHEIQNNIFDVKTHVFNINLHYFDVR